MKCQSGRRSPSGLEWTLRVVLARRSCLATGILLESFLPPTVLKAAKSGQPRARGCWGGKRPVPFQSNIFVGRLVPAIHHGSKDKAPHFR